MRTLICLSALLILSTMAYAQIVKVDEIVYKQENGKDVKIEMLSDASILANGIKMEYGTNDLTSYSKGIEFDEKGKFTISITSNDNKPTNTKVFLSFNFSETIEIAGKECNLQGCRTQESSEIITNSIVFDKKILLDYSDMVQFGYLYNSHSITGNQLEVIFEGQQLKKGETMTVDPIFDTSNPEANVIIATNESHYCEFYCEELADDIIQICYHADGTNTKAATILDSDVGQCRPSHYPIDAVMQKGKNVSIHFNDATDADAQLITGPWDTITSAVDIKTLDIDTTQGTAGIGNAIDKKNDTDSWVAWLDDGTTTEVCNIATVNVGAVKTSSADLAVTGDITTADPSSIDVLNWNGSNALVACASGNSDANVYLVKDVGSVLSVVGSAIACRTDAEDSSTKLIRIWKHNMSTFGCAVKGVTTNDIFYEFHDVNTGALMSGDNNVLELDVYATGTNIGFDAGQDIQNNSYIFYQDDSATGDAFVGAKIASVYPNNTIQRKYNFSTIDPLYMSVNSYKGNISFCNNNLGLGWADGGDGYANTTYPRNMSIWTGQCYADAVASNSCTYSSGDFNINCADNCQITASSDINQNKVRFYGTGSIDITGKIFDYSTLVNEGTACYVVCRSPTGECFA